MAIRRLQSEDLFVCIGKVLRPVGTSGALKLQNYSDIDGRFQQLHELFIGPTSDLAVPYKIQEVEHRGTNIIVTMDRHDSIEAVEHLRGQFCFVPRSEQEALDEDEFYVSDLLGMDVFTVDGVPFGTVREIIAAPANDVMVIDTPNDEVLLPMVGEVIQEINLEDASIIIQPIEGLQGN